MDSNIKEIIEEVVKLKPNVIKSIYRAKNKAITKAKTEAKKMVQTKYNIKSKDVAKTITLKKASYNNLNADISFKSHTTPITAPMLKSTKVPIGKRKSKAGKFRQQKIKVLIKKGSYRNLSGGKYKPFLMRVNAGSKLIVARRTSKNRYSTSQVRTVPVAKMVDNQKVSKKILEISRETYYKEFNRLMELKDV